MYIFKIIIHTIFLICSLANCYIAYKNKNISAFNGWLCAIIMDIPNILTLIN